VATVPGSDRGRITITDGVYILFAVLALAALYPPFKTLLDARAHMLGRGEELVLGTVLPAAALVLLAVIYIEAAYGGPE
jgi:hypothetical protein